LIHAKHYWNFGEKTGRTDTTRKTYTNFRKIGWGGMDWIDLAVDRNHWKAIVNTGMNLRAS
jgi:hypothetical protein